MSSEASRLLEFAARNGAFVNKNNGIYVSGQAYGFAKKLEIAAAYKEAEYLAPSPSINAIAKKCHVSWYFVDKIRSGLIVHGRVLRPSEISECKKIPRGAGSKTLNEFDCFILLQLHMEEPIRSLSNYVQWLFEYTGTVVSKSTVSRFFSSWPFQSRPVL